MKHLFGENHGLDEKSVEFIAKAIEKANLPGFDYLEFRLAVDNLKKMNLDEPTAIKSAFMTANTMGLTKEKLLQTAQHYKSIVQKEREQFDAASAKQQETKIGQNLKQVDELKKQIAEAEAKIRQAQMEIETAQGKIRELDYEREGAAAKLEDTKTKYLHTHQSLMNQMEKDIQNIQTIL
jgi:predicted  nucleic acid-binding Zn-ribbon protein